MVKKIFRSIMTVSLAVLSVCIIIIMTMLYQYFEGRFTQELASEANYIAQGIENEGMNYFNGLKHGTSRITLIGPDGTVLFDSDINASTLENHADREEIKEAFENSIGQSSRYSETMSKKTLNYALRLSDGSVLRISGTKYSVFVLFLNIAQPIAVIIIALMFLSGIVAFKISKNLVKPINEIDFEHPERAEAYEELTPFLRRISSQNKQINAQINELKQKQQEFIAITENMSEGLLIIDAKTNILSYNTSALRLLGINDEVENKSILTINRSKNFRKSVDEALFGKHSEQKIQIGRNFYNIFANPVFSGEELKGAVMIIMDITEKEQRENLRREFSANVSHELKTPLTSISGFAEIMKNGIARPEDMVRFSERIYDESQRMITLIGDIIKLSQLDENMIPSEFQKLNLLEVCKKCAGQLSSEAEKNKISVSVEGSGEYIQGVSQIIEEIVYNLCDNAIKYNKPEGNVILKVFKEKNSIILSVSDSGSGIPDSDIERVFERFYRVDKSHSKDIGGTGLGLSIVKHGAEIHHAEIKLESSLGKGTEIKVIFPQT